jgi:hypothetical protein
LLLLTIHRKVCGLVDAPVQLSLCCSLTDGVKLRLLQQEKQHQHQQQQRILQETC